MLRKPTGRMPVLRKAGWMPALPSVRRDAGRSTRDARATRNDSPNSGRFEHKLKLPFHGFAVEAQVAGGFLGAHVVFQRAGGDF